MIAIYARQSVDREDSISTDSQIEACKYEAHGEPCRTYVDKGYSGKNTERPQFQALVQNIREGSVSKVIVYRLDRISRSILDFSNLMVLFSKYGVEFVSSSEKFDTSTPMGRAMLNICMVFAQLERETIQQRVTDAYYSRSEKGFYMGGRVPYGFRLRETVLNGKRTKTYTVCEEEAAQIRLMYQLYAEPNASYGDILTYMNKHGLTCRGNPWSRARIAEHLKNPIYVCADLDVYDFFQRQGTVIESDPQNFIGENGCYYYKGRTSKNRKLAELKDNRLVLAPHRGIVPADLWLKCRKKCLQNKQIQPGRKISNTWLAGLVKCGNCHYALTLKKYKTRRARYLICSRKTNSKTCAGAGTIYADDFEALIYREIINKLEDLPVLYRKENPSSENRNTAAPRIELAKINREMNALVAKVASANESLMELINARVEELKIKQSQLERELSDCAAVPRTIPPARQIQNYMERWNNLTLNEKRTVAGSLIEIIYATSETVEIYWKI